MTCSRNEVVLLPIPFTDLTSRKVRPAIVVGRKGADFFGADLITNSQHRFRAQGLAHGRIERRLWREGPDRHRGGKIGGENSWQVKRRGFPVAERTIAVLAPIEFLSKLLRWNQGVH